MGLLNVQKRQTGSGARERAHFDALAARRGELWWGHQTPAAPLRLARRARLVVPRLAAWTHPRVLEVGCGAGTFTRALLECLPQLDLLALDISPKSVEVAQARCHDFANLRFAVADATAEELGTARFEAIVGNSVLHHIDTARFLRIAFAALVPGGLFAFYEPNMLNPQVAAERHIRPLGKWLQNSADETAFFRWRLQRQLEQAGFRRVSVAPFDFLHPASPRALLGVIKRLGRALERVPLMREIAGSLQIVAYKPGLTVRP